jgi:hypothetical protein
MPIPYSKPPHPGERSAAATTAPVLPPLGDATSAATQSGPAPWSPDPEITPLRLHIMGQLPRYLGEIGDCAPDALVRDGNVTNDTFNGYAALLSALHGEPQRALVHQLTACIVSDGSYFSTKKAVNLARTLTTLGFVKEATDLLRAFARRLTAPCDGRLYHLTEVTMDMNAWTFSWQLKEDWSA